MSALPPDHSERPFSLSTPFVGRDHEMRELRAALDHTLEGRGQVVLLAGEPGIGKTRTAQEFATVAAGRGARVLWGRCIEWEGAPAFWPWIQLLRVYVHERDAQALHVELGPGAPDIAQLVPELRERIPDLPPGATIDPEQALFRLFDSMTGFVKRAAASTPLVLIIDDLHWADTSSLLLLQFIARDIADAPVLIFATCHNVDTGQQQSDSFAQTLAELSRGPHSHRIPLQGIAEADINRFLSITTGRVLSSALVSMVQQKSGGNPFFVSELMRLLLTEPQHINDEYGMPDDLGVPESVRDVINRRLARLSDSCNDALAVASVIGRQFNFPILVQVSGRSVEELFDALDEAVQARILEEAGTRSSYRFSHALIQDTLYAQLSTARRLKLHAGIGAVLTKVHVANLFPYLSEIAYHFWQAAPAGFVDKAVDYTFQAAQYAMTQLAYEDAAKQCRRALHALDSSTTQDGPRRCDILLLLGEAQRAAGLPEARATFLDAAAHARAHELPDRLARAALGLSSNFMLVGFQDKDSVALLQEAVAATADRRDTLHARCLAHLAVRIASSHRVTQAEELVATSEAAVEAARTVGDPEILAIALHSRHVCLNDLAHIEESRAIAAEMEAVAEASDNRELMLTATVWRTFEPFSLGDITAVDALIERAGQILHEIRQPNYSYVLTNIRAHRAMTSGRIAEGFALAEQARRMSGRIAISPAYSEHWWIVLTELYRRETGDLHELLSEFMQTDARLAELDERFHGARVQAMKSTVLATLGRLNDARRTMARFLAIVEDWPVNRMSANVLYPVSHLAETACLLDDHTMVTRIYRILCPFDRFNLTTGGNFMSRGSVAHFLGLLSTTLERWDDAERHFGDALVMNQRMGMLPYVARTQHAWASMLLRRNQPGDVAKARDLARQAGETARQTGMTRLTEEVDELIVQTHTASCAHASDRRAESVAFGLTPRELDVLRLIAEGKPDREIADALFISPRTVTTHVTSILHKLEAPSRSAAVAAAIRQDVI